MADEDRSPWGQLPPSRVERAEQIGRRIALHVAHGRYELAAAALRDARDELHGLASRRSLGLDTPLATIADALRRRGDEHDHTQLLRVVNCLEEKADVHTVGGLLKMGPERFAAIQEVGPKSRELLKDALILHAYQDTGAGFDD